MLPKNKCTSMWIYMKNMSIRKLDNFCANLFYEYLL